MIFAVFSVLLAVNMCINYSFFTFMYVTLSLFYTITRKILERLAPIFLALSALLGSTSLHLGSVAGIYARALLFSL